MYPLNSLSFSLTGNGMTLAFLPVRCSNNSVDMWVLVRMVHAWGREGSSVRSSNVETPWGRSPVQFHNLRHCFQHLLDQVEEIIKREGNKQPKSS